MKLKQITYIDPSTNMIGFESLNDKIKSKIGREIKNARIEQKISGAKIRKDLGIEHNQLMKIEAGTSDYTIGSLNKLRVYLGLIKDVNKC